MTPYTQTGSPLSTYHPSFSQTVAAAVVMHPFSLPDHGQRALSRETDETGGSASAAKRQYHHHSLVSVTAFRVIISLLGLSLLLNFWFFLRLEAIAFDGEGAIGTLRRPHHSGAPHLHPRLPHLPAFPSIEDEDLLANLTLYEDQPTIAGIGVVLYKHLRSLHNSNRQLVANITSGKKKGGPKRREEEADAVRAAYFGVLERFVAPLEDAYRGRLIFRLRDDESIFLSVVAFREHLLAETLASAFRRAAHPDRLFVGVIINNCFGTSVDFSCKGTAEVVGKDKNGLDVLRGVDGKPDANPIEAFCKNATFASYCVSGQLRVLYFDEVDALGPAVARYYCSKLWGGENYFMQVDSHTRFASRWDELYIADLKLTSSFPKVVLSTYPPGFVNFKPDPPFPPGTRLCRCEIRVDEDFLPRVELRGHSRENETHPSQTPFMGAGFFIARADFLIDVPFDPYLPWLFMGEEVALSIRAWTSGWNMYAPRKNLIGHQYRPVNMGNPHFWDIFPKFFHRPKLMDRLSTSTHDRIKVMMGYPEFSSADGSNKRRVPSNYSMAQLDHYGLGKIRPREEYLKLAKIDIVKQECGGLKWCAEGTLQ